MVATLRLRPVYPMAQAFLQRLRLTLDMIKFEHSVFALPFALTGALLAFREERFRDANIAWKLLWIVVAMVAARSAAMAFNRLLDADIDARNPRTKMRHLAGRAAVARLRLGLRGGLGSLFCSRPRALNPLCLKLSPVALGDGVRLFVHEALYVAVAPGARVRPGHCSGGCVDRGTRLARSANPVAHGGGHVLDGRFRHHLLLPGLRLRLRRGSVQRPARGSGSQARCGWRGCCT